MNKTNAVKWLIASAMVLGLSKFVHASDVVTTTNAGEASYGDILWYSDPTPGHPTATYAPPSSIPGLAGLNGTDGVNGTNGADGAKGETGVAGKDGANGRDGRDASVPAIDPRLDVEVREFDSKHWSMSSFASFGMQSGTSRYIVGQKLTLKLGKSYEEKQRAELEKRMEKLLKNSVFLGQ